MAGCYWGAKTKPNKVAWGLFAALAILGIGFWVPGMLMTRKCLTKFSVCTGFTQAQARNNRLTQAPSNERVMRCVQQYRGCVTTPGIIWGVGWLFLVASCIPCFYFCCCSKNPDHAQQGHTVYAPNAMPAPYPDQGAGVQMAGYPAATPFMAQQPPPYGQPPGGYPPAMGAPAQGAYPQQPQQFAPGPQQGAYGAAPHGAQQAYHP